MNAINVRVALLAYTELIIDHPHGSRFLVAPFHLGHLVFYRLNRVQTAVKNIFSGRAVHLRFSKGTHPTISSNALGAWGFGPVSIRASAGHVAVAL
jgi:hypothetical protein